MVCDWNTRKGSPEHARAVELEPENVLFYKEYAGACLTINNLEDAHAAAIKAVEIRPDDNELLGNLAIIKLVMADVDSAKTTIEHALKLEPSDEVNQNIQAVINDVSRGKRPCPKSLDEVMRPTVKPKSWLARLLGW